MTDQTPAQSVTDPATTALIERISAALGQTGPVLTPLQALLVDVRARLWEMGQPAAEACAPGGSTGPKTSLTEDERALIHRAMDWDRGVRTGRASTRSLILQMMAALQARGGVVHCWEECAAYPLSEEEIQKRAGAGLESTGEPFDGWAAQSLSVRRLITARWREIRRLVDENKWNTLNSYWTQKVLTCGDRITAALDAKDVAFDLISHLHRQREFSERTFGPGKRSKGIIDHIGKELREIEAAPHDLTEWVDVVILALDGAWRAGYTPEQISSAIAAKQENNEGRTYPDWRTMDPEKAIEHDRTGEPTPPPVATGDTSIDLLIAEAEEHTCPDHSRDCLELPRKLAAALRQRGQELATLLRDAKDVQQKWCDESNRAIRLEDELAAATARADEAEAWLGRIYKEWEELGFSKDGGARLWQYITKGGEIFRGSKIQYGEVQTLCGCTRTLLTKPCSGPVLEVPLPARLDFTSMLAAADTPSFEKREFEYCGIEYRGSHAVHIYRERARQARG